MTTISKKVCLLGDFAVGKTSLVRRFVHDRFEDKYISTIGVKVSRKTVQISKPDRTISLTLMLWDLASTESFSQMRAAYLRGSAGAILVCDRTRPETLANLSAYAQDLLKINTNAILTLVANKQDLERQHQLSLGRIETTAEQLNAACFLASAKTGESVEALFQNLANRIAN